MTDIIYEQIFKRDYFIAISITEFHVVVVVIDSIIEFL